jgi:signal transduction histidine kinase
MEKDQLKRIFDEFYRADKFVKLKDSAGLGLSICKRIVEKLGGRIWADSKGLGKGSIFYFTLKTGREK